MKQAVSVRGRLAGETDGSVFHLMFVILSSDITLYEQIITDPPVPDTEQSAQLIPPNGLTVKIFSLTFQYIFNTISRFYAFLRGKICVICRKMSHLCTTQLCGCLVKVKIN